MKEETKKNWEKVKNLCWLFGIGVPLKELRRLVEKEIVYQQKRELEFLQAKLTSEKSLETNYDKEI